MDITQQGNGDQFTARNWMFIPTDPDTRRGIMSLSGIAIVDFSGVAANNDWHHDVVRLGLIEDQARASLLAPWDPGEGNNWDWTVQHAVAFVTPTSRYSEGSPSGSAVDDWKFDPDADGGMLTFNIAALAKETITRVAYRLDLDVTLEVNNPNF